MRRRVPFCKGSEANGKNQPKRMDLVLRVATLIMHDDSFCAVPFDGGLPDASRRVP